MSSETPKEIVKARRPRSRKGKTDEQVQALLDEIEEQLEKLDDEIESAQEEKTLMFAQVASEVKNIEQKENIDEYHQAFGVVRKSLIDELREDLQRRIDGLSSDMPTYFSVDVFAPRARLRSCRQVPQHLVEEYVAAKGVKFVEKRVGLVNGDLHGILRWTNDYGSFKYFQYNELFDFYRSVEPTDYFFFMNQRVRVRHDPNLVSRHLKHHYLFEQLDQNENVRAAFPVELEYDLFRWPTAFYAYGPHLLLVTSFNKIATKLIFNMLKKLDTKGEMPDDKPEGFHSVSYFALFDRDFKLVKEFIISENLTIGSYSFLVDFLNEEGIMISKKFRSERVRGAHHSVYSAKRLVTFYDYSFRPIFEDVEPPNSADVSGVLKFENDELHLIYFESHKAKMMEYKVYDIHADSMISSSLVPRRPNNYIRPNKYLLDSKNNMFIITRCGFTYKSFVKMHGYLVACVNLDTHAWHQFFPRNVDVFYRGAHVNESDQLVISSQPASIQELEIITFAV